MIQKPIQSILLIDDHEVVRSGCRRLVEQGGHFKVVAEADSGEQGLEQYRQMLPDVVIMDLLLPNWSGLETSRRILSTNSKAKIIIFTVQSNIILAEKILQAGVKAYVTKSSDSSVLLEAIKAVSENQIFLSPDIAQSLALKQIQQQNSPFADLTAREFEVFKLAAQGEDSSAIGVKLHLSPKTVSNYLYKIKQKLNISTTAKMAHLAIHYGIIN